ncbi:hypothetical protein DL93DRAFT_1706604 [Clavulina sp. PMI_390]|nr:hypothetical protein DL93DRAFT_1706604 [Clavulina sp. PMI_390]
MVLHVVPPLGTTLIGNILASTLFGVITVQSRSYFSRFRRDSRWIRTMVLFLWFSQFVQVVLTSRGLYRQAMASKTTPYSHGPPLIWYQWDYYSWGLQFCVASIIVQLFFSYRLWTLSQRPILNLVTTSLILANGALGLGTTGRVYASKGTKLAKFPLVIGYNTVSVFIDILLAGSVAWTLRKHRTGFIQTDRVLNQIILYGVATGALTSLFALVILLCAALGQRAALRVASVPSGGIYIVCALAHLHSRAGLRMQLAGEIRLPTASTAPSSSTNRPLSNPGKANNLSTQQTSSPHQPPSNTSSPLSPLRQPSPICVTQAVESLGTGSHSARPSAEASRSSATIPPATIVLQAPIFSPASLFDPRVSSCSRRST